MSQDSEQLRLLSIFHYILAGLTALFSSAFLIHIAMGIAMLTGALDGKDAPPAFFGWFFILLPAAFILGSWSLAGCMIAAGRKLVRHESWLFCTVIAALECVIMPLGTVLGVFTIVVLMRDSVKQLFGRNEPPA